MTSNEPTIVTIPCFSGAPWDARQLEPFAGRPVRTMRLPEGLDDVEVYADFVANIVRHHHEGFDGSGYPDGLAGEAIPLLARIIALADSYDAMAETRAYHRPKTHLEIMTVLDQETGQKYDPGLMRIFAAMIETSPFKATVAGADENGNATNDLNA